MKMKSKNLVLGVLLLCSLAGLRFLSMVKDDETAIAEHLNSTYSDYAENPDHYILTEGKIVDEYNPDLGNEINFFESRAWLVEVTMSDGTVVQTVVLRDKNDKFGETIQIAYEKIKDEDQRSYMNATQLKFIQSNGVDKSIRLLTGLDVIVAVVVICYFMFAIVKRSSNRK